tara:strand:+ start:1742 stop:2461 length:720 start_codon:yes stop_codon:yes gene_type:complete
MTKGIVLSLYDFTGEAVRPWALAGYECHIYDIQHPYGPHKQRVGSKGGSITTHRKDLHRTETFEGLLREYEGKPVVFGMAFPVCTDMAVSGAAHFARKAEADPLFQDKAVTYAMWCGELFEDLRIPYFIENPVSVLATKWRKPDHRFQPYEYGGYIPDNQAEHPRWPEYIAARDAYPKKTCLWTGGGFVMPTKVSVTVPTGYSTQHKKLGGKSQRTKDIRSATPRGFAIAVCEANMMEY